MIPRLYKTLASAIRNKRRVIIRYKGHPRSRVVEPHVLFKSGDGGLNLLAYQVRGHHSSKRSDSFWRAFQLRKIDGVHVTHELFAPRVNQGYAAVAGRLTGEVLAALLSSADEYRFFDRRVQGPPLPAYLASTPQLMLRQSGLRG